MLDQNLLDVKANRKFRIFKVVRELRQRSNRIGKKLLRQRARPMRRGLPAKAILAQRVKDLPMDGPEGLVVHFNQQIVLLDVSRGNKPERNANDFLWHGRVEQIQM